MKKLLSTLLLSVLCFFAYSQSNYPSPFKMTLKGLYSSIPSQIQPTDSVLVALSKIQAQINYLDFYTKQKSLSLFAKKDTLTNFVNQSQVAETAAANKIVKRDANGNISVERIYANLEQYVSGVNRIAYYNNSGGYMGWYEPDQAQEALGLPALLSNYATVSSGSWTPASATVTLTVNNTFYQTVGNLTTAYFSINFPVSVSGSAVIITGLPNAPYNYYPLSISVNETGLAIYGQTITTDNSIHLRTAADTPITYAQMSGTRFVGSVTYRIP